MRILLVEDDQALAEQLSAALRQAAQRVDWVGKGEQARIALGLEGYEVVILDLGLPDMEGLQLLPLIQQLAQPPRVLILTARDELEQRVQGLDAGADDYLSKPFELDELLARLRALGRRQTGFTQAKVVQGGLSLDLAQLQASWQGQPLELSRREFMLLRALAERPGQVKTRASLEADLYGWGEEVESNALEVHIHHLRRKLGKERIRTLRGIGYSLELGDDG
ncbi:response regulator [Balneatrix alpica]|uniref:Response regulator n=1 Tax=Balneatrix alpica TaxID=75684 RepID=A0ABV5Z9N4_9GAMM|nr:response regulator [Balneatrix alpica]